MFRLNRNERSHWSGNGVHVESELVFMIGRNMHDHLRLAEWHPRFIRGHTYRQFRDDSTICLAEQKSVAIVTWNHTNQIKDVI